MANILNTLFPAWTAERTKIKLGTAETYTDEVMPKLIAGNSFQTSDAENISTVFTCIKILSDTLSRLPVNIYQSTDLGGREVDKSDYRYEMLHYNPNNYTTSQTFFAALEYYRNLHGNSFARIRRNNATGRVLALELLASGTVVGYQKVNGELYYLLITKKEDGEDKREIVSANEILHFKMVTKDGVWGASPIEALRLNLSTTWKGMNTIDTFYENNAMTPKALKSSVPDAAYRQKQKEAVEDFKKKYVGPKNAGEMIILPEYTEIQSLTMSLVDAEFIGTIKFNSNQIASVYGVPPHLVGNYEASKFNNVEQLQLNFKANTIDAIARMYRQELEFKLLTLQERTDGKSIEFNFMAFVETDAKTRFEGYKTLFNLGSITPNKISALEGFETFEQGDLHFLPGGYTAVEGYVPGTNLKDSKKKDLDI